MQKLTITVGSNNDTKELETEKILEVVQEYYASFTTIEAIGYWQGSREKSLQVIIIKDAIYLDNIEKMCDELNDTLQQDSIMIELVDVETWFQNRV